MRKFLRSALPMEIAINQGHGLKHQPSSGFGHWVCCTSLTALARIRASMLRPGRRCQQLTRATPEVATIVCTMSVRPSSGVHSAAYGDIPRPIGTAVCEIMPISLVSGTFTMTHDR